MRVCTYTREHTAGGPTGSRAGIPSLMAASERPLEGSPSPPASPPLCTSGHASSCAHICSPSRPQPSPAPHPTGERKKKENGGWGVLEGSPEARRGGSSGWHSPRARSRRNGVKRGARIICSNCDGKPQEFALQKVCREVNGRPNSLQVCRRIGSSGCDFLAPVPQQWLGPCVSSRWDPPQECHPWPGKGLWWLLRVRVGTGGSGNVQSQSGVAVTRDGDTRGAAPALPPSCATAPGLVHARPRGWGLLQLLRHHQLLCSPKQPKFCLQQEPAPSQQRQGSFPSHTCREQGEFSGKLQPL